MAILQLRRPETASAENGAGTWGELVAWFSEMVLRLDRGDLAGAASAQAEIEKHGFKITYRRLPRKPGEVAR
jgi:hypothetical protein